jgi:hypothetical protein
MNAHSPGWVKKYETVQRRQIATYVNLVIGALPVAAVDTGLVVKVLEPISATKTMAVQCVREIIEDVLGHARADGHRTGENRRAGKGFPRICSPSPETSIR